MGAGRLPEEQVVWVVTEGPDAQAVVPTRGADGFFCVFFFFLKQVHSCFQTRTQEAMDHAGHDPPAFPGVHLATHTPAPLLGLHFWAVCEGSTLLPGHTPSLTWRPERGPGCNFAENEEKHTVYFLRNCKLCLISGPSLLPYAYLR